VDTASSRLSIPNRSRVPAEFTGLARAFRSRMLAAHCKWETPSVELISLACERRNGFRKPKATRVAELWRLLPGREARLALLCDAKPGKLGISELRIFPASRTFNTWPVDADELSVSVTAVSLILKSGIFISEKRLLADVGLHALARRFQRGIGRLDKDILTDLAPLAGAYESTVAKGGTFTIAGWGGVVGWVDAKPLLSVRTFLPPPPEPSEFDPEPEFDEEE